VNQFIKAISVYGIYPVLQSWAVNTEALVSDFYYTTLAVCHLM